MTRTNETLQTLEVIPPHISPRDRILNSCMTAIGTAGIVLFENLYFELAANHIARRMLLQGPAIVSSLVAAAGLAGAFEKPDNSHELFPDDEA